MLLSAQCEILGPAADESEVKKDQEYAIDKDNNTHYNVFKFQLLDYNEMQ